MTNFDVVCEASIAAEFSRAKRAVELGENPRVFAEVNLFDVATTRSGPRKGFVANFALEFATIYWVQVGIEVILKA